MQRETVVDAKNSNTNQLVQLNRFKKNIIALSSDGEKSSVKCINRKSQVPSKCQKKPYIRESSTRLAAKPLLKPVKIVKSKKNYIQTSTCPQTFEVPDSCRKSISMIELSPYNNNKSDIRSERRLTLMGEGTSKISSLPAEFTNVICPDSNRDQHIEDVTKKAARLVCHVLTLNAWRRRREYVGELQSTIEQLGQQIDHLRLQIVVLRKLLDTENSRVDKLGAEVHRAKAQLDGVIKEKDLIQQENNKLENELKYLKQLSEERRVAAENLKNDLFSTKSQLEALDSQMVKEREKIQKLREDKKFLLEKVSVSEARASEGAERAQAAERMVVELQDKLGIHQGIIESLQEDKLQFDKNIDNSEAEKMELNNLISNAEKTEKMLNKKIINLEMQLNDRETAIQRIESIYKSQLIELNEMKKRFIIQSQENGWSNRVLNIAGSVVRAPRAILRTFLFLVPGGMPSHP